MTVGADPRQQIFEDGLPLAARGAGLPAALPQPVAPQRQHHKAIQEVPEREGFDLLRWVARIRIQQAGHHPQALQMPLVPPRVWQALQQLQWGQTCSYAALAERLGNKAAVRAVGAAVGRNPWSIVVPCHRVLGADGGLTGYAGGLDRKRALLALESARPV